MAWAYFQTLEPLHSGHTSIHSTYSLFYKNIYITQKELWTCSLLYSSLPTNVQDQNLVTERSVTSLGLFKVPSKTFLLHSSNIATGGLMNCLSKTSIHLFNVLTDRGNQCCPLTQAFKFRSQLFPQSSLKFVSHSLYDYPIPKPCPQNLPVWGETFHIITFRWVIPLHYLILGKDVCKTGSLWMDTGGILFGHTLICQGRAPDKHSHSRDLQFPRECLQDSRESLEILNCWKETGIRV